MPTTIPAPDGAEFEYEEVKTKKGTESLGEVPILVWKDADKAVAHFTTQGILNMLDGTSARVAYQSIARRGVLAKKTEDEIAKMQIDYRPGNRVGGASTPVSRAARAAKSAVEKVGDGDQITKLLDMLSSGAISKEQLAGLLGTPAA